VSGDLQEYRVLLGLLGRVYDAALVREVQGASLLDKVHPRHTGSARNLLHYAAIRSFDLRELQARLTALGLSSLGRAEVSVLPSLCAVARNLSRWLPDEEAPPMANAPGVALRDHQDALRRNTDSLLGHPQKSRRTRILVTAPTTAADDPHLLRKLLGAGMDLLRINCAHDDEATWEKMVRNVRQAEWETNRRCRILFDMAGPKLRTGPIGKEAGGKLTLSSGDLLWLLRKPGGARNAKGGQKSDAPRDRARGSAVTKDQKKRAARIGCSLPAALDDLGVGDRVFFDDGKISARVLELEEKGALLQVLSPGGRSKLKADKGINLPDTELSLPALMPQDLANLDFVIEHADLVGQSFLRGPADVLALLSELESRNASHLGVILKVETPGAFARLPEVLLSGMHHEKIGVMVARGDLAVEVGFERLAEAQEEILWMAEAAHVPVIWATQVLENLAKTGMPTRAEVTDAAMSGRAECVMLNKGPYVADAVRFLDDVLRRMESHQQKKRSQLRALSISEPPDRHPGSQ
jgi:pyruvate kinase